MFLIVLALLGAPKPQAQCSADVAALKGYLGELSALSSKPAFAADMKLAPAPPEVQGVDAAPGPLLVLDSSRLVFDGRVISTKQLAAALKEADELWLILHPKGTPPALALGIAPGATWAELEEVTSLLGSRRVNLLFASPQRRAQRPRSAIDRELDRVVSATEMGEKARHLSDASRKTFARCPAGAETFGGVEEFVRRLPAEIARCGCDVDLASVKALSWMVLAPTGTPATSVPLSLGAGGKAVTGSASSRWPALAAALVEAGRGCAPVRLTVDRR